MKDTGYMLSIRCMTYNHARYITDAMNGFCIQQTNFPFVALIVDDASTDGEQDIIKDYLDTYFDMTSAHERETEDAFLIEADHKENKSCHFVVVLLKKNLYHIKRKKLSLIAKWEDNVKYRATCEGDDYWTDPLKLQKQVDFLEQHEECSLCCHRYKIYSEADGQWLPDYVADMFEQHPDGFFFTSADNFDHWITKTMTLLYRRSALTGVDFSKYKYSCDVHHCYHILQYGTGYCMPDVMAVYRRHQGGVFSPLPAMEKNRLSLLVYTELSIFNSEDTVLRAHTIKLHDKYMQRYVRPRLYWHEKDKSIGKDVRMLFKHYYSLAGWKAAFLAMGRCAKSYISGFRRRG
ncbi:MAG: glycosyltransferase [Bacteroidales bacterium]|nr:glycosyltransferase [Bacteroidales bacterium]